MRPFAFQRAGNPAQAVQLGLRTGQGQTDAAVQFLSGGTTLIDLMKLDVLRPQHVVDLSLLQRRYESIDLGPQGLYLGAFATMAKAADHPAVVQGYPAISESLQLAASAQLRNMATLGGNVLQKTRCPYFRDPSWQACNKRIPNSGCAAIQGFNRNHAVLGVDDSCISQYPGDLATVLVALDAQVELYGPRGSRRMPFSSMHTSPNGHPHIENTLQAGEFIIAFVVPSGAWNQRSLYLKVRDRSSYEFAIAAAAVALDLEGDNVRDVRIGLGGVAYRPWRSREAEQFLIGKALNETAAEAAAAIALEGAKTHGHNDYKPALVRRTLVRALLQAQAMPLSAQA